MFTGIIEKTGIIKELSRIRDTHRLSVYIEEDFNSVKKGDNLAINGACLTVTDIRKNLLLFDVMDETFKNTSFPHLKNNDVVNLERALRREGRLEGHFVLGHVDGKQKILSIEKHAHPYIDVSVSTNDKKYVVRKGSITIDGISLTIGDVYTDRVRVYLIPYTLGHTSLRHKNAGDWINVEFDILGKYMKNYTEHAKNAPSRVTAGFLKDNGFI